MRALVGEEGVVAGAEPEQLHVAEPAAFAADALFSVHFATTLKRPRSSAERALRAAQCDTAARRPFRKTTPWTSPLQLCLSVMFMQTLSGPLVHAAARVHNLRLLHPKGIEFPNTAQIGHVKHHPKPPGFRSEHVIPAPYLLYLGNETDELSVKTSRGLAYWRPDLCVGEFRDRNCGVSLGLPEMSFQEAAKRGAKTLILGVANAGGVLGVEVVRDVVAALEAGLNVASGLHQRLHGHPQIAAAAARCGCQLFDVRDPPPGLSVGKGVRRAGRRLLTVGTDCSIGKMYTTLALQQAMRRRGLPADFRATGQTGILIGGSGVPVDAVIADFISGSVEWLSPARNDGGWDLIEGQGSLFHPSFAGVSLGLLHGAQPDALVLCHEPGRAYMRGVPGRSLPDLRTCLEANLSAARLTNPEVTAVGVSVNTSRLTEQEMLAVCAKVSDLLGLPCQDPVRSGVDLIVDRLIETFPAATERETARAPGV